MPQATLFYVEADELPDLPFELEGIDLSTFSSIKLRIRLDTGGIVEVDAVIDDAPNGLGHFEFATGEIIKGNHLAEIRTVRASDSKPETFPDEQPMQFIVRGQI